MDDEDNGGGLGGGDQEGGPPRDVEALAEAKARAMDAMEIVVNAMRRGGRHAQTKLSAAKLVLQIAGVSALEADQRHTELLRELRGKVSEDAWSEVVSALAESSGIPDDSARRH